MHEYYKKKSAKLKKTMRSFLKHLKPELEAELQMPFDEILEDIWEVYYHKYMENFPYIGGDKISGTSNLTGAYCYVAMGDVVRRHGISLERWGELTTIGYRRFFEQFPSFLRSLVRKLITNPKIAKKVLSKKDIKNAANVKVNPDSFVTELQPNPTKDLIEFHNITCPLAAFAVKMNCTEYMPYICNLDYVMFEALQVPFYREKTCAAGDAYCDFKMKPGAPIVPAWPCHGINPEDPLK